MVRACPSEYNSAMEGFAQLIMWHPLLGDLASLSSARFSSEGENTYKYYKVFFHFIHFINYISSF